MTPHSKPAPSATKAEAGRRLLYRLAFEKAHDVFADRSCHSLPCLLREGSDVRNQDHVGHSFQIARRWRLRAANIECGPSDLPSLQSFNQSDFINHWSTRCVNEVRRRLHLLEAITIQQPGCLCGQWNMAGNNIRLGQQIVKADKFCAKV